jgi:hypothetical protein
MRIKERNLNDVYFPFACGHFFYCMVLGEGNAASGLFSAC